MSVLPMRIVLGVLLLSLGACSALPPFPGSGGDGHAARVVGPADVPQDALERFYKALSIVDTERWEEALLSMQLLWEDYPQYAGPPLNAALIQQRQAQPAAARKWFLRALEANGESLDARNAYAVFLREQGDYEGAEEQYLAGLAISSEHAATHYNLGILYDLYTGKKSIALQHYEQYQALTGSEDRRVAGWIADLQRQLALAGERSVR